jgi:hypothetical protein
VAQVRPGCVPASVPPSPARPTMKGRGVPGGVCPAAHVVHPAAPAGRLSAGWRSETWPGGFARAGQSRQPGTDRPGSSARALLPRPRVTPGGGTFATRPLVRVRWGYRCRVVCPLGARAVIGPRPRRPTSESPGFAPHRPHPARGSPGSRGGCFGPRALHVVPNSERVLRAVLGDGRFTPSAPVQRPGPRPDFARAAGFRAITVRTGARRPLQGRTRRCRDAGRRI